MTLRLLAAPCLFALLLLTPRVAGAYCRTTTCDESDASQECELDGNECVTNGIPLFWASRCVTFGVQRDGSLAQDIDAETISEVTERAFSHWIGSSCTGGRPSLRIGNIGPVACAESRYNETGHNANIVIFRDDDWPHPGAVDTYGFTRVRFDTKTGEIFDADIEINSNRFELSVDGDDDGVDLESILTHEIGHFLGLSHASPGEEAATMRADWNGKGQELRTLSADDGDGICAIYPPGRQTSSTSCDPRHGFSSECNVPLEEAAEGACTFARQPWSPFDLVLVAGAFGVIAFRRKRHRSNPLLTRSPRTPHNRQNCK